MNYYLLLELNYYYYYYYYCFTTDILKETNTNASLIQGIGEEIDSITRTRLEEDPDYSADKYPSAQKHFKPNK